MKLYKASVTRKSDGKLVYGNEGYGDVNKIKFERECSRYSVDEYNVVHIEVSENDDPEFKMQTRKNLIKNVNADLAQRFNALVEHCGLDK